VEVKDDERVVEAQTDTSLTFFTFHCFCQVKFVPRDEHSTTPKAKAGVRKGKWTTCAEKKLRRAWTCNVFQEPEKIKKIFYFKLSLV
jgi:hypothetical protein